MQETGAVNKLVENIFRKQRVQSVCKRKKNKKHQNN